MKDFDRREKKNTDVSIEKCEHCGEEFEISDYALLANCIMGHPPACSKECNDMLMGQNGAH